MFFSTKGLFFSIKLSCFVLDFYELVHYKYEVFTEPSGPTPDNGQRLGHRGWVSKALQGAVDEALKDKGL